MKFSRILLLTTMMSVVSLALKFKLERADNNSREEAYERAAESKTKVRKISKTERMPASLLDKKASEVFYDGPAFVERDLQNGRFNDAPPQDTADKDSSDATPSVGGDIPENKSSSQASRVANSVPTRGNANTNKTDTKTPAKVGPPLITFRNVTPPIPIKAPPAPAPSPSPSGASIPRRTDTLTCTADVGAGAFPAPISVTLSCSAAANIKYCLGQGSCCAPNTDYTAPITVGSVDDTFCLTFEGTSSSASSPAVAVSYIINSAVPDVQTSPQRVYYQTTELNGVLSLTSNDYGRTDHSTGVINFKDHDTTPSSCEDLVENPTAYSSPSPVYVLADLDVSGYTPLQQLDVFLTPMNLVYGPNNLVTYVKRNDATVPAWSCTSNVLTLEDFPYFESLPAHGDTGSNTLREFAGGFTSYGHFEPAATVYRGPASGSQSETQGTEKLASSLFSVFY